MGYMLNRCGVRIIFARAARAVHCDTVSLTRYKLKILELYQGGYRYILEKSPDYFDGTMVKYLLPVERAKDSVKRIMLKMVFTIALNKLLISLIETWLTKTDKNRFLYFPPFFRAVIAGWGFHAIRSKQGSIRIVHYGAER
jgi:hypothetical protein